MTTIKLLETLITQINKKLNRPLTAYTKDKDNNYKANIGNYHLDQAYGGCALHEMANESGGVNTINTGGYVTKALLYAQLKAMLSGIEMGMNK